MTSDLWVQLFRLVWLLRARRDQLVYWRDEVYGARDARHGL
jgi:hypothetical protein